MSAPLLRFPCRSPRSIDRRTIAEFIGLERAKKILAKFAAHPYPSAWLFVGPPGVGKTAMALALAAEIGAEFTTSHRRSAPHKRSTMFVGCVPMSRCLAAFIWCSWMKRTE